MSNYKLLHRRSLHIVESMLKVSVFSFTDYQGLTKSFSHGKIYCSLVTAKLVNMKLGIPWERLQVLDLGQKVNIGGIDVTCFDANHCPGSLMLLFEPANGKVRS